MSTDQRPVTDVHRGGGSRGRDADSPLEIPRRGWTDVLARTKAEAKTDNVALLAAGIAFYTLLALVPALVAFVSIYGLVADPGDVGRHIGDLLGAAPAKSVTSSRRNSRASPRTTGPRPASARSSACSSRSGPRPAA